MCSFVIVAYMLCFLVIQCTRKKTFISELEGVCFSCSDPWLPDCHEASQKTIPEKRNPPTNPLTIYLSRQKKHSHPLLAKVRLLHSLLDAKVLSRPRGLVEVCSHGRHNQQWFQKLASHDEKGVAQSKASLVTQKNKNKGAWRPTNSRGRASVGTQWNEWEQYISGIG